MKYTVVWTPQAEAKIANLWVDSDARASVAAAADSIDASLSHDPLGAGESRGGELRILFVWPLAVEFVVSRDDMLVQISNVWRFDLK